MSDTTSTSALLDGRLLHGQKAVLHAFFWVLASLATAAAILGIVYLVSNENERRAGRMLIDGQKGKSYLATVTSELAASQGRPKGF